MHWRSSALRICPQLVHIFNSICTHASVFLCFAAFLLSSGECLQSWLVWLWTERIYQKPFLIGGRMNRDGTCLPVFFINKHLREVSTSLWDICLNSEGEEEESVLSNIQREEKLAKVIPFWLQKFICDFSPFKMWHSTFSTCISGTGVRRLRGSTTWWTHTFLHTF